MLMGLQKSGVSGGILELTKQMYTKTSNVVRLNGMLSKEFISENGVLQGNNYSPTIFINYINDLLVELQKSGVGVSIGNDRSVNSLAYAEDIVLLAPTQEGLQKLLNITNEWCRKWRVVINTEKTKILHFRHRATK